MLPAQESFENRVNAVLNKARDDAGKKAQNSLNLHNNIIKMVTSGSKGSFINISQMMGCVGQQVRCFLCCLFLWLVAVFACIVA